MEIREMRILLALSIAVGLLCFACAPGGNGGTPGENENENANQNDNTDDNMNDNVDVNDNLDDNVNDNLDDNVNDNVVDNDNIDDNLNTNDNVVDNDNVDDNDNLDDNDNTDGGGNDQEPTLERLDPITFFGDVVAGTDPMSVEIDGGSVDFAGGVAMPVISSTLSFDDSYAWMVTPGDTSTITFTGLDVRVVSFYFADLGGGGGTLRVISTAEEIIETVNSVFAIFPGDTAASFEVSGGGASIARLEIDVPSGLTVSLDHLELTIAR
jgi:hypothetical protein